ncbi:MAG: hypothetical protein Q7U34_09300, partial [Anaerolineales bacterium]|nr:hypothetical protein [Anaerolineales bacterium]
MDTSDLNPVKDLTVRRTKEVVTVGGSMLPEALSRVDAHAHLWIERVDGAGSGAPVLDDRRAPCWKPPPKPAGKPALPSRSTPKKARMPRRSWSFLWAGACQQSGWCCATWISAPILACT